MRRVLLAMSERVRTVRASDVQVSVRVSNNQRVPPVCWYPPHQARRILHYLNDCRDCPPDEKRRSLARRASEKDSSPSRNSGPDSCKVRRAFHSTYTADGHGSTEKDSSSSNPTVDIRRAVDDVKHAFQCADHDEVRRAFEDTQVIAGGNGYLGLVYFHEFSPLLRKERPYLYFPLELECAFL